jgi:rubrerythrin
MSELTLKEAIDHAKLIKSLSCKVCGEKFSIDQSLINLVAAIRNDGYCPYCNRIHQYRLTHNGKYPDIDTMLK